jgi:hypothetical protein
MSDPTKRKSDSLVEVESTDRWVAGKDKEELLQDLRAYLARLRDDPRSIPDRLRVAAIQLRLGRVQEALIHYEGVVRGYVEAGQVLSAIALCHRILAICPEIPRLKRILTALYARAPRGTSKTPRPVTPFATPAVRARAGFVVDQVPDEAEPDTGRKHLVDRVFPELTDPDRDEVVTAPPSSELEEIPTTRHPSEVPYLLTRPKTHAATGEEVEVIEVDDADAGDEEEGVVLLTKPKGGPDR